MFVRYVTTTTIHFIYLVSRVIILLVKKPIHCWVAKTLFGQGL